MKTMTATLKYLDNDYLSKFFNNQINLDIQKFNNTSNYDSMCSHEIHNNLCKYWALDLYYFYQNNKDIKVEDILNEYFKNYNFDTFSIDEIINIKYLMNDGINIINYEQIEKYIEDSIHEDEDEQFFLEMEKYNQENDFEYDSV